MEGKRRALAAIGFAAAVGWAAPAGAFCRTMACPLPADFSPAPGACVPADFASFCASLNPPARAIPVWWRNACVSYDLNQTASAQVPYAVADAIFGAAFARWTSVDCPGAAQGASARVSIDTRDLGPVACGAVQYSADQPNQHVIVFHDQGWPYDDQNNTLGLTTVTFDPETGEIYDADMELNATVPLTATGAVPAGGYDLQSIATHESGHFLGMAHSGDPQATMFAHYTPGTTSIRALSSDDVAGICSIYLPGGQRVVDPSVGAGGRVMQDPCDPTPRHGFTTQCAQARSKACDVGPVPEPGTSGGQAATLAFGAASVGAAVARRARAQKAARRRVC